MNGLGLAEAALERARGAGAHSGDAVLVESESLEVRVRGREVDTVSQARERTLGLRVFVERPGGLATAVVSTSDLSSEAVARLAEDAVAIARATAPDPSAGLPADGFARDLPDLDLYDPADAELAVDAFIELARRAEQAARGFDPRITNSEGSSASRDLSHVHYASSAGFRGEYRAGSVGLFSQPVAAQDGAMQTAWWADASRKRADLAAPEEIGRIAASARSSSSARAASRRARRRSSSTRPQRAICSGTSWPASPAPPSTGAAPSWLASSASASRASASRSWTTGASVRASAASPSTARASRRGAPWWSRAACSRASCSTPTRRASSASPPPETRPGARAVRPAAAPTNLWLEPGSGDVESLIRSTPRGLLVTGMFGHGFNPVTGDFSRGARGFWIEGGARAFPVEEITIAGNLGAMLTGIDAIGADLRFLGSLGAPSLRISRMTIAGAVAKLERPGRIEASATPPGLVRGGSLRSRACPRPP